MDGLTHTKQLLNLLCIVYIKKRKYFGYFYLQFTPCRGFRVNLFISIRDMRFMSTPFISDSLANL